MGLLHVLLAVALTLGGVRAGLELAVEGVGAVGVLVIHVAITLLFGWPSDLIVLAGSVGALPGARMGLLVLGQVARTLEDPVAVRALLVDVHWRRVLLATSHGAHDTLIEILIIIESDGTLVGSRGISLVGKAGGHGDKLAILQDNQLDGASVLGETTLEGGGSNPVKSSVR
jgi:hypothetical protein